MRPTKYFILSGFIVFLAVSVAAQAQVPLDVTVSHFAGNRGGPGRRDGIGSDARFTGPSAMCSNGRVLFVADYYGLLLRKVDPVSREVTTLQGERHDLGLVTIPAGRHQVNYVNLPAGIGILSARVRSGEFR